MTQHADAGGQESSSSVDSSDRSAEPRTLVADREGRGGGLVSAQRLSD